LPTVDNVELEYVRRNGEMVCVVSLCVMLGYECGR